MIRERTAKMSLGPLFWTPTVQGLLNYEYVRDNPEQLDDPSWQVGLPQSIIDDIKGSLKKPGQLGYYQITPLRRPTLARKISQLSESGVVLLIGTDSGIPMNFHSQTTAAPHQSPAGRRHRDQARKKMEVSHKKAQKAQKVHA
jgi:hypothetical protein